jgi:UDP-N-acetylmuramyl pentapeptide synthase
MLTYQDVSKLFSKKAGIVEETIQFHTVSSIAGEKQPKGLFVPVSKDSGSLQEAIANGAIAALWPEHEPVPAYKPNHFPLFFTEDILKGLEEIMKSYLDYLAQHEEIMSKTNFIFQHKELLNEKETTYDIAVMAEKINHFISDQSKAGEE